MARYRSRPQMSDAIASPAAIRRFCTFLMGGSNSICSEGAKRRIISARRATMSEKHSKTQSAGADRGRKRTDWHYLDCLTDDESVRDRDAAPLDIDWSKAVIVVPPKKKAISIRVDPDVLDFFKNEGPGYQRRINAVLRSYVEQKRGKSA
jgi:uncharacterized protein (DUF4415 family)